MEFSAIITPTIQSVVPAKTGTQTQACVFEGLATAGSTHASVVMGIRIRGDDRLFGHSTRNAPRHIAIGL
jgi:hypothetical protein